MAPVDDKLRTYERSIGAKIRERLRFRKDVISKKCFRKHIREAFEADAGETNAMNNMDVTGISENIKIDMSWGLNCTLNYPKVNHIPYYKRQNKTLHFP